MNQNLQDLNCPIHSSQQMVLINTESTEKQHLKCLYCVFDEDNTLNINNLIPIGQIMDEKCLIINNWPILKNKQLSNKVKKHLQDLSQKTNEKEQIHQFFISFRQQIIQKIDELEQQFIEFQENSQNLREEILKKYNNYNARENMRDIIISQSLNIEQKNTQISEIIHKTISEQSNIQKDFSKSFEEIYAQNLINFENMNLSLKTMMNKLSTIQTFLKKDEPPNIQLLAESPQKNNIFGNYSNQSALPSQTLFGNYQPQTGGSLFSNPTKPTESNLNTQNQASQQSSQSNYGLFGQFKPSEYKLNTQLQASQQSSQSNQGLFGQAKLTENKFNTQQQASQESISTKPSSMFSVQQTELNSNIEQVGESTNKLENSNLDQENQIENNARLSRQYKIQLKLKETQDKVIDQQGIFMSKLYLNQQDLNLNEQIENIPTFNLQPKIQIFLPQKFFSKIRYGILIDKLETKDINILKLSQVQNKNQVAFLIPEIDEKILIESFSSFYIYDFIQNKLIHEPKLNEQFVRIISLSNNQCLGGGGLFQMSIYDNTQQFYKVKQTISDLKRLQTLLRSLLFSDISSNKAVFLNLTKNKTQDKYVEFEEIVLNEEQHDFDWKDEFSKHYQSIKWN